MDDALSKMIPELTSQVELLDGRSCKLESNIHKLDKKLEEVKNSYSTCRNTVDREIEDRIAQLRKQQKKLKQELTKEEEKQVNKSSNIHDPQVPSFILVSGKQDDSYMIQGVLQKHHQLTCTIFLWSLI